MPLMPEASGELHLRLRDGNGNSTHLTAGEKLLGDLLN